MSVAYYCGPAGDSFAAQIGEHLGQPVELGYPEQPAAGDTVFLAVRTDADSGDALPGGNAFSACRALKETPRVRVFVVVDESDRYAPETARFCLADGCVMTRQGKLVDTSAVDAAVMAVQGRADTDALLARLEGELASDAGRQMSAIQRMLQDDRHSWVLEHLTDSATGLFCGEFASFKLEEEFKRAMRFHQPLSLMLLDIGEAVLPAESAGRDTILAEAASVFLVMLRDIDVLARFTETTFLFLLPGTGAAGAATVAQRMLEELRQRSFTGGIELDPHAGLATVPAAGIADRGAFLARAEACLRLAIDGCGTAGLCISCE